MSKRKASSESIEESREGPPGQGADQPNYPTSLPHIVADIAPADQTDRERVPGRPKGPELATGIGVGTSVVTPTCQVNQSVPEVAPLAVVEGHVIPTWVPVGPVGGFNGAFSGGRGSSGPVVLEPAP